MRLSVVGREHASQASRATDNSGLLSRHGIDSDDALDRQPTRPASVPGQWVGAASTQRV